MSDEQPIERVDEATVPVAGRLLEAKGTDETGGRVFRFRIIEANTVGRNARRYPSSVLSAAANLYAGAKAFDRHRSDEDLRTSTIAGLVGAWRNVEVTSEGIEADLHLLPSATHTAEALDASLAAADQGLPPLIGSSHDVFGRFRAVVEGGRKVQEATEIVSVNSVDVVADPAAGGRVTRMVAGGTESPDPEESAMPTFDELVELINGASPEQKATLADLLGTKAATTEPATEPESQPEPKAEEKEPALAGAVAEGGVYARDSMMGRRMVRFALEDAGFGGDRVNEAAEAITPAIPDRFTESELEGLLTLLKPRLEVMGLLPSAPHVTVGREAFEKKVAALDAMFISSPTDPNFGSGYRSIKDAYLDITGTDARRFHGPDSEDFARHVLRESLMFRDREGQWAMYDADARRATESGTTATWAEILGDSVTRRLIAEYNLMGLNAWRLIVSSVVPLSDFRTQRLPRLGGYGLLPTVAQGTPYQALTTPGDEEATYSLTKRGGTEDLTIEAIANDDLRALQRIPAKLGRAAAQTLYRFVFDILVDNANTTYDSTPLFDAGHNNTDSSAALSNSTLSTGRRKMIEQTAYGNSSEVLGTLPRYLVVPPELEETAFQITTSTVAKPSSGDTSDMPNLHQGLTAIMVPYYTDANDWFLVGDPNTVPTIEVGFYQGRQNPELFVQNDPTVGSLFNADKITWKIRHIYSGTVLDHRGFYRGVG